MRQDDEDDDRGQVLDMEQVEELAAMDPRARQLLQLLMRSQDIDAVEAGSDDSGGGGGGDNPGVDDAPVVADVELDLTARPRPESPPAAQPGGVCDFCREHGIDPAALPTPDGPVADPGASFESVLSGGVSPVGITELQLVSRTTEVDTAQGHRTLGVRHLALCGRLKENGQPASFSGNFAARLYIEDVAGEDLRLLVTAGEFANMAAEEFAREVTVRYPRGTAVALKGFDLIILPESFMCVVDGDDPAAEIHRLGNAALPPVQLCQIDNQCTLLQKAGALGGMVRLTVDGVRDHEAEVQATLHPLLVALAVAHLRLGADGLALAYATAAAMLVFQRGPPAAASVAAQVLNRMGLKNGACSALYLGHFPHGHALEPLETAGHEGLKVLAAYDGSRSIGADERLAAAIKDGMTQIAEGLASTERQWLEHGLADATDIQAAAERALSRHGADACAQLKQEGDRLFRAAAGASEVGPVKSRPQAEEAVRKWRAALWLQLDREGPAGNSGYSAWNIVNTRYQFWHEAAGTIEPKALHYMDLAALTVLRGNHVNPRALRSNVYKGRCRLGGGQWEAVLDDALQASLGLLDIAA